MFIPSSCIAFYLMFVSHWFSFIAQYCYNNCTIYICYSYTHRIRRVQRNIVTTVLITIVLLSICRHHGSHQLQSSSDSVQRRHDSSFINPSSNNTGSTCLLPAVALFSSLFFSLIANLVPLDFHCKSRSINCCSSIPTLFLLTFCLRRDHSNGIYSITDVPGYPSMCA